MSTETVPVFCMCVKRGESTDSLPFGDWHSDHSDYRTAAQASSKGAFKAHELNWTELELRNKQPHVNSRIKIGVLRISQEQSVLVRCSQSSRDADARDQWTCRVSGLPCCLSVQLSSFRVPWTLPLECWVQNCSLRTPVQFSSCAVNKP